jgi:hypothetical protein
MQHDVQQAIAAAEAALLRHALQQMLMGGGRVGYDAAGVGAAMRFVMDDDAGPSLNDRREYIRNVLLTKVRSLHLPQQPLARSCCC